MAEPADQESDIDPEQEAWDELSPEVQEYVHHQVNAAFFPGDVVNVGEAAIAEEKLRICGRIALRARDYPVILDNVGMDLNLLAYHFNSLRLDTTEQGEARRALSTHWAKSMTPEERAMAYYQEARYWNTQFHYGALVASGAIPTGLPLRLARYRPTGVPMAELSRMPDGRRNPSRSPSPMSEGSANWDEPTAIPSHKGADSGSDGHGSDNAASVVQQADPDMVAKKAKFIAANKKRLEAEAEAERVRNQLAVAKSQAISATLDEIHALGFMPVSTRHLLTGLPIMTPVPPENFFDWLHIADIPYDAAIDELPGKQLTTGEGEQVQVPKYDAHRHGGEKFHKIARRAGRVRAAVRREMAVADTSNRMAGKLRAKEQHDPLGKRISAMEVQGGPRDLHAPLLRSRQAVRGAHIDPNFRSTSVPRTETDFERLRAELSLHYSSRDH
ncbi:hypothetical protein HDE_06441 [Halotydeus destructor]|nr:hypothetical protein HDE_06441 [Halotydeus destructor]